MIRIKDYIFNENRIVQMCINEMNNLEIDTDNGFPIVIKDATFEDIEWNYGSQVSSQVSGQVKELEDRINEAIENAYEEENKKIEKLDLSDWWEITSSEDCKPAMLAEIFNKNAKAFSRKINEIIDKINKGEENASN